MFVHSSVTTYEGRMVNTESNNRGRFEVLTFS